MRSSTSKYLMGACLQLACTWLAATPSFALELGAPSPLLAIDRNRATVVDRIVTQWGPSLATTDGGVAPDQLREMLQGMRSDQLLAASLAGSLEGLRRTLAGSLPAELAPAAVRAKSVGDLSIDVVYVPVTPCRLVETRGTFPAVYQGGGAFTSNEVRSYTLQGGNGVCLTQLPPGITPGAVQLQVYGMPTTAGSGDIEILPEGGTFGSTATLVYLGNNAFTSSSATSLVNTVNNQISVQVRGAGAHVAIDVVGYFRAPTFNFQTIAGLGANEGDVGTLLGFIGPTVSVTLPATRPVMVMANKAMGSTAVGGATELDIDICYQTGAGPIVDDGDSGGILDLRVAQNTRQVVSYNKVLTLPAGTHTLGLCGSSTDAANWNSNEWGRVTAIVL